MSTTDAGHHVQDVINLLDAAASGEWTNAVPTVENYWDVAQSEKGPGADQPAELYVWSPATSDLEQFSMDGEKDDRTDQIEVQVWSLDPTEARQYQTDAARILGEYIDDNAVETPYSTVKPTGLNDYREQKAARRTDHYILSVEVEPRGLADTTA
jgi:hypothetical protein